MKLLKDRSRRKQSASNETYEILRPTLSRYLSDILFSTAHKAKGLEFSTVRVLDDFLRASIHGPGVGDLPEDEYNLLYVAATRAIKRLRMSRTLFDTLKKAGVRGKIFVVL